MKRTGTARTLALAWLVAALAACASGGAGARAGRGLTIRVANDLVPPAQITVWMVSESGGRRRLGIVQPDQREEFSYVPISRTLEHRLLAETADGREITSDPFTLDGIFAVTWGPNSRIVRFESSER